MNRFLQTLIVAAPMVIAAPYVAAETHPAQKQMQQNIDAVLKIARNTSLTEAQRVKQVEQYANRYLDYERISALAVGAPWREFLPNRKLIYPCIQRYGHCDVLAFCTDWCGGCECALVAEDDGKRQ